MSILGTRARVWSQSLARKTLLGEESQNPSLAARFLLGRGRIAAAGRILRRVTRRRPFYRGNPVPALVGAVAGGVGLPKLGRRVDPKKHAIRMGHVTNLANRARLGDEAALLELQRIGSGIAWPGQWADVAAAANQHYELIAATFEEKETKAGRAAAARAAREGRFLEAGTSALGSLAQAAVGLGRRGGRRPARRRRRPRF